MRATAGKRRGKGLEAAANADTPPEGFGEALRAAAVNPTDESLWERLEQAAASEEEAARLLRHYRAQLTPDASPILRDTLARRAFRFAADCFGETAPEIAELLKQILAVSPEAEWAFAHLSAALTTTARWSDLLDAHDARLKATSDPGRRRSLLAEATHIAKDLAGDQRRAADYLSELFTLEPANAEAAAALERLLERQERWADLVDLWRRRLPNLPPGQIRELRRRIALVSYEKLAQPEAALAEARQLLPAEAGDADLGNLLERVLKDERAAAPVRLAALDLRRTELEARGERPRITELLPVALGFAQGEALRDLRRESAERQEAQGDASGALEQYAALLSLVPEDREVEQRLRRLAEASGNAARLAQVLRAAAEACPPGERRMELLMGAAGVHDRALADPAAATDLLEQAVGEQAEAPALRLQALRRLDELYASLGNERRRVHTLERLATVEPEAAEQRRVWASAAEHAAGLGEIDRALAAWQARLLRDPADAEALSASARLLTAAERWQALIELLRGRMEQTSDARQIRADLVEIASLARDRLGDIPQAIEAWREVSKRFGEDASCMGALADLYERAGRFDDLAELLERSVAGEQSHQVDTLARLGDTLRERLAQPERAIDCYGRALAVDVAHDRARAGLKALLTDSHWAPRAAEPLARAAERAGEAPLLLDLLPHRLAGASEPMLRLRLLEEAAALAERRAGDTARAFQYVCQALPLGPGDLHRQDQLLRLAEATGDFPRAAEALAQALAAGAPPPVLAQLGEQRAQLLERLGDLAGAHEAYAAALARAPERLDLRQRLIETSARVGRWGEAAAALVDACELPVAPALLSLYQSLAATLEANAAAAEALAQALARAEGMDRTVRRDLELQLARLLLDRCGDAAGADRALGRALDMDPGHLPALLMRADLQRRQPDRALFDTLVRLGTETPDNLDFLHEACQLAVSGVTDDTLAGETLARLWSQAERLIRRGKPATGQQRAEAVASYALEQAVGRLLREPRPDQVRRAVDLLAEAETLPFPGEQRLQWLRRAAELTQSTLGDRPAAIELWRRLHQRAPEDGDARETLARLLEDEQRYGEVLSLRLAELPHGGGQERRLTVRLEIVRLCRLLESQVGSTQTLKANLQERPGHPETLRQLTTLLTDIGRLGELGEVLEQQARTLEEKDESGPAAGLWAQLAALAEQALGQPERAVAAWERVAELEPNAQALDALARLKLVAGDAGAAAGWLERRLSSSEGEARIEITANLARAYLAAGQRHRAIACLDRTLAEFPLAHDLRAMLADLYRSAQAWEPLARVLAEGCAHVSDEAEWIARARSAVELYTQVGSLARAVPLLENLVRLQPQDEGFRSTLAEGLRQSGRLAEARAQLSTLIEEAGWRRSRKRAALHRRLAEVARAEDDLALALEQLELAASMDLSNRDILQQLAEVADARGADERAERAYRSLLVMKRQEATGGGPARSEESSGESAGLGLAEILLRLHDLARKRGEGEQATELMESALTAATTEAGEAARLQRLLLERGEHAMLDRLFDKRLAQAAGSAPAEADVHAQRAAYLRAAERRTDALEAYLLAIAAAPERTALLTEAVELGRAENAIAAIVDRLVALADSLRRRPDAPLAARLLLQAAQLAEDELGDLDRALAFCRRAEESHGRPLDVWDRLARLARKRGDAAECARLVSQIKQLAVDTEDPAAAADALYRAAEIELGSSESRETGLVSLCLAVEKGREVERALELVARVGLPQSDLVKILPLYERVARQSGDERMLLDYLERRCATHSVTVAEAREAVDLAVALERADRIEPLLLRLAEVASERPGGEKEASWALLELVQRRKASGDLEAAAAALEQVADRIDPDRALSLSSELSERAARGGNLRLAARLLEKLRARTPEQESIWRPLLQAYTDLKDGDGLDKLVSETLPLLLDPRTRNELRLARARFRLERDERDASAVETLRDALLDDPNNGEVVDLLTGYFERTGADGELVDLLEQGFERAAREGDRDQVRALALRLGSILERGDQARAAAVYQRALEVHPGQRDLLRRLVACTPLEEMTAEKAALMEDLLGPDAGADASQLAKDLADIWERLGDEPAVLRVLEKGWAIAPEPGLAGRLEHWYRGHDRWQPLADLLAGEAERQSDANEAAALLREAAALRRTRLDDAAGALQLLGKARHHTPHDVDLLGELIEALRDKGDLDAALAEVRRTLADPAAADQRLALLFMCADLERGRGDRRAAVAALQEACAVDPSVGFDALYEALSSWHDEAAKAGDTRELQEATVALVTLLRKRGALSEARELIEPLMHTKAADAQLIRLAGELAEAAGDLEAALTAASKLGRVAADPAEKIRAAEQAADLAERLGRPAEASGCLEAALAANPGHAGLVSRLMDLLGRTQQPRKLALLLLDQAQHSQDDGERFERLSRAAALFLELGEGSSAMMALNDALTVRPNDHATTLMLSDAYLLAGSLPDAAGVLKPLITAHKGKSSPALAALYGQLARIAARAGDPTSELQALNRAVDADRKNGALAAQLADRAEAAGDDELLVKALRTIVLHPGSGPMTVAMALLRQARLAQRQGDNNRAMLFARQAIQAAGQGDPVVADARAFLKSLGAT